MPERECGCANPCERDTGIICKAAARPERQLQTGLQSEEDHRSVFELFADNFFCSKTQAVAVKADGALQVIKKDIDPPAPPRPETEG